MTAKSSIRHRSVRALAICLSGVLMVAAPAAASGAPGAPGDEDPALVAEREGRIRDAARRLSDQDPGIQLDATGELTMLREHLSPRLLAIGLRSHLARVRQTCAFLLGLSPDGDAPERLLKMALEDKDEGVRRVACDAVQKQFGSAAYRPFLRAAVQSKKESVRLQALAYLAEIREPKVVPVLTHRLNAVAAGGGGGGFDGVIYSGTQRNLVTDFDVEIAQAAVIADPIVTTVSDGTIFAVRNVSASVSRKERKVIWDVILASSPKSR